MIRLVRFAPLLLVAALLVGAGVSLTGPDQTSAARGQVVPGSYIVTLKPGVNANLRTQMKAQAYGFQVRHVYTAALNGFSATLPARALEKLKRDPDVLSIVQDRFVYSFEDRRPTGIRRSQADRNPVSLIGSHTNPIDVDVAVIDSGVDAGHPDLNVVGGVSCVPGDPSYHDPNGHGTHVAGTIGALDNGSGVVGVAPGARIWAVRVLNASGEGSFSDVICGIDWVTANAGLIEVANMSLGGEGPAGTCNDGGLRAAVCRSVSAGVTYVVAAGNSSADAANFVPASFPEVITVSAIVDTDGAPGGRGGTSFFYGPDDSLAAFSNYGAPVDIAAPGFNIYSTWPGGGYFYNSGTSMASPHVAGAAAIYAYLNPSASPAAVRSYLRSIAWAQNSADGFSGDVDGNAEPVLNAGPIGGTPLPPPTPACTLSADHGTVGASISLSCLHLGSTESVRIYWDSTSTTQRGFFTTTEDGAGTGALTVPDAVSGPHQVIVQGQASGVTVNLPFTVDASLKLQPATGKAGGMTMVTLTGFPAASTISLTWDDDPTPLANATASATGRANVSLFLPESVAGPHSLTATAPATGGGDPIVSTATFTVQPGVTLQPTLGKVGANSTVVLRGFSPGETVTVRWYSTTSSSTVIGSVTASVLGTATLNFVVPASTKGAHAVEATGNAGSSASAAFTVSPTLTLPVYSSSVGAQHIITLTGFAANEPISIRWYATATTNATVTTATASANGSASIPFVVPEAVSGQHRVEAVGPTSGTAVAFLSVSSTAQLTPSIGLPGTSVTVALTGFRAGETINIKWFSTAFTSSNVSSAVASSLGSASATFAVPADASTGEHKVEATGGASFARGSATFTVESSGPPPPTDPTCTTDLTSGQVGSAVRVTCVNFAKNEMVRIFWDDPNGLARTSIWTGASGGGAATFPIPDAPAGPHQVMVRGGTSGLHVDIPFTVLPSIKLTVTSGKVGAYVSTMVKGFAAGESVSVSWDGGASLATITTNASGSGSALLMAPESLRGEHNVRARGATSGLEAATTFTVVPSVTATPGQGSVGTTITVTARGFGPGEAVVFRWYDTSTAYSERGGATASTVGSATVAITVPSAAKGIHTIEGVGADGSLASMSFTVAPSLTVSSTNVVVGAPLLLSVDGFAANEALTVQWFDTTTTSTAISTPTTSETGSVAISIQVPEAVHGSHRVQVFGGASGVTIYKLLTVWASLSVDPTTGEPGTVVTAIASGYRAGETVNVSWYSTAFASSVVASGVASPLGSVALTFAIPAGATVGDHKVETIGQSSFQRTNVIVNVTQASAGGESGSTSNPSPSPSPVPSSPPAVDTPFSETFGQASAQGGPVGWSVAAGSAGSTTVSIGSGGTLVFATPTGDGGACWLIREGAVYSRPDVQTKLTFYGSGAGAGIVLAWNGPNDYVVVLANADLDRLEVIEVAGGDVRTNFATERGSVTIKPGRDYWLRAGTGTVGGRTWVSLYWSEDGRLMRPVAAVEGLANLWGGVGLATLGNNAPAVEFDDLTVRLSDATQPVQIAAPDDDDDDRQPMEPTATPTSTEEPVATETSEATPSPTDLPTQEVTPTETATPEPTPTEPPAPEPTATEPAAPEPPPADVGGDEPKAADADADADANPEEDPEAA